MINLADIRTTLESMAVLVDAPLHISAFSAWVLGDEIRLRRIIDEILNFDGQGFLPEHVAALGYAHAFLQENVITRLKEELDHLGGRTFFVAGRPRRFEVDGVALLGVALAVSAFASDQPWLSNLLMRSCKEVSGDEWQEGLIQAARIRLGQGDLRIQPVDLAAALGMLGIGRLLEEDMEAGVEMTLSLASHNSGTERNSVRLAIFRAALARLGQVKLVSASHDDLVNVLRRIPDSLRLWRYEELPRTPRSVATRWEIENEYHVQALVWTILAPFFPDIEEEENLPSVGHKNPRADITIPSLKTIIEVKFVRSGTQSGWSKMTEEVAADSALYLSHSAAYDNIVALVWDDTASTEQHGELQKGLEKLSGVSAAVIISRPGKMSRARMHPKQ
jgi:hypothetical protein